MAGDWEMSSWTETFRLEKKMVSEGEEAVPSVVQSQRDRAG